MKRRQPLTRTPFKRTKPKPRHKSYVRNAAFQEYVRDNPCTVNDAACFGVIEFDHIVTRGAGGHDEGNGWPLCTFHHALRHSAGVIAIEYECGKCARDVGQELYKNYVAQTPDEAA